MSRSVRGKVTLVEILLLKAKSCLKRLRWMHNVSGRWVTREYFRPFRSFLPEIINYNSSKLRKWFYT